MKKQRGEESYRKIFKWSYTSINRVPESVFGVYAIWYKDKAKCIYVGKAEERPIRKRLKEHWNGSHNETLMLWIRSFSYNLYVCFMPADKAKISCLERRLIKLWKPEANKTHNPNN